MKELLKTFFLCFGTNEGLSFIIGIESFARPRLINSSKVEVYDEHMIQTTGGVGSSLFQAK